MVSPRAGTLDLRPEAVSRLDALVESEASRVTQELRQRTIDSPLVALAFIYTEDENLPVVTYAYACTSADRDAAIRRGSEAAREYVWSPPDWTLRDFMTTDPEDEIGELAARVAQDLERIGVDLAAPTVLGEIAWRMSRQPWTEGIAVSDDFTAWASEHEFDGEHLESFTHVATKEALHSYRANDWLRIDY